MLSSILSNILAVVIGLVVCSILGIAGYRVVLHPLARYPGPFLAKLTDAYAGFRAFRRRLHLDTYADHIRYGPILRHGPDKLIFNSATALRDIYRNDKTTKADAYLVSQAAPGVFNLFNAIDNDLHRTKRQLVGAAVSERAMRAFEPVLSSQVDLFVEQLLGPPSQPIDMTQRTKRLGLDIVGLLSFGYPLRLQTEETNRFLINAITVGNYRSNVNMQFPSIHRYHLHDFIGRFFYPSWDQFTALLQTMIGARMAEKTDARQDFYAHVSDALAADQGSRGQLDLWTEAMFFTIAGGDTTATAICAAFFYLSRNPDVYEKLAHEIRSTFQTGSDIRGGPALSGCRFLRAVIDETLRMSPPVPSTPWRQLSPTAPDKVFTVDGHIIPKGVSVGVNVYSLHHNEAYFPEPFKFSPERWLPSDGDGETEEERLAKQVMRDAFCPFSVGARSCAGKAMAYLEAGLTLAKTLWYFDFEPASGALGRVGAGSQDGEDGRRRAGEFQLFDTFSSVHFGPHLVFKPRGGFAQGDLGLLGSDVDVKS